MGRTGPADPPPYSCTGKQGLILRPIRGYLYVCVPIPLAHIMKPKPPLPLLCLLVAVQALPASENTTSPHADGAFPEGVRLGSTEEEVTSILGEPESRIELGEQKIIHYRLAKIVFEKGGLIQGSFMSEKQRAREDADKQVLRREALARKEKLRAENLSRTTALRDQKLQDPDFLLDTPEQRLRFWHNLKRQCPELDLGPQIQEAVLDLKEFQKMQVANRVKQLEAKVLDLEQQAAQAEKKAQAAEKKVAKAEARLDRIKLEASRFPFANPIVYPRSTGIYIGPNGRFPITYDPVSGTWRAFQTRPTLQINLR